MLGDFKTFMIFIYEIRAALRYGSEFTTVMPICTACFFKDFHCAWSFHISLLALIDLCIKKGNTTP